MHFNAVPYWCTVTQREVTEEYADRGMEQMGDAMCCQKTRT